MNVRDNNFAIVSDVFRSDLDIYINTFTDNHLLLYVYLQRFNNYRNEVNLCLGWLYEDLHIVNNKKLQSELTSCFVDLIEFKLIELVNDIDIKSINKNTRLIVSLTKNEKKGNFTMIYDSEIDKILNLDKDIRQKKSALLIYCIIASRINKTSKYCYPRYDDFKNDLRVKNNNCIKESIDLLQDNKLINYRNVGSVAIYGDVEMGNNVYVLCIEENYKAILERAVADRTESYKQRGYSITNSKNGDRKRSLSQLIRYRQNKFDNGVLDDEGMAELLQYENEYFELIKNNQEAISKQKFVLFNPGTVNVNPNIKVVKSYFGKPNSMLGYNDVDADTGEFIDNDNFPDDFANAMASESISLSELKGDNVKDNVILIEEAARTIVAKKTKLQIPNNDKFTAQLLDDSLDDEIDWVREVDEKEKFWDDFADNRNKRGKNKSDNVRKLIEMDDDEIRKLFG